MQRPDPAPTVDLSPTELIARQQAMLMRLAEDRWSSPRPPAAGAAPRGRVRSGAELCVRAARAVRLTIALQTKLAEGAGGPGPGPGPWRGPREASRRRDRIHARVEQAIDTEFVGERDGEQLSSDAWERLTDADDADLLDRPMHEVVARICADLGLSPAAWALLLRTQAPRPRPSPR